MKSNMIGFDITFRTNCKECGLPYELVSLNEVSKDVGLGGFRTVVNEVSERLFNSKCPTCKHIDAGEEIQNGDL